MIKQNNYFLSKIIVIMLNNLTIYTNNTIITTFCVLLHSDLIFADFV